MPLIKSAYGLDRLLEKWSKLHSETDRYTRTVYKDRQHWSL